MKKLKRISIISLLLLPVLAFGASDLEAQIAALLAQIQSLQAQLGTAQSAPTACNFSRDLTVGSRGEDVKCLQQQLAVSPASGYFGPLTKAAVAKWQEANGVSPVAGYFGPKSRARMASTATAPAPAPAPTPSPAPTSVPTSSSLTVRLAPDQPTASLAPANAQRIPFTKIQLTAGSQDATVSSLTVERRGLSSDSALASVVLLDEAGNQVGQEKTFNSEHKANIGAPLTIKAGQTRTLTVAGNRASAGSAGGQTMALSVTAVNGASATGLPVTGTTHVVNESLSLGSATVSASPMNPSANTTKEVGTTGYTFASVKVTAGSGEKVRVTSVRWYQAGSATAQDVTNLATQVDGTNYPTTADGRYHTSNLGNGVVVDKGFSKELTLRGDITSGSGRTADFNIEKASDLAVTGETYGYGLATSAGLDGHTVTISGGNLTVSKQSAVNAQNIALNANGQTLGGWTIEVRGESVSVGEMTFTLQSNNTTEKLTNLTLVNEAGQTLAGPTDAQSTSSVKFTDAVTFPVGTTNVKLTGKLSSNFANNDTVKTGTNPSSWKQVRGENTGNAVTPTPSSLVESNTMTAKAGSLSLSVSPLPISQQVVAGASQFEFARYTLNAGSSGEDLRMATLPTELTVANGNASDLTNCKLYRGDSAISETKNPTSAGAQNFALESNPTLPKGEVTTLSLRCDVKSNANGSYAWGYNTSATPEATSLASGQSVAVAEIGSTGQTMTAIQTGSLSVSNDAPSYQLVTPGTTVELNKIRYNAGNEDVSVKQVALQLSGSVLTLTDQKVSLYDGTTKVGEATFASGNTAKAVLSSFTVPKFSSKTLTVKATMAGISASGPNTASGNLVKVDYDGDNNGLDGNHATGLASGQTITPASPDTTSNGVRLMKAHPKFEKLALDSGEKLLMNGTARTLYKFKVTAVGGEVSLAKFTFTTNGNPTVSNLALSAYHESGAPLQNSPTNPDGLLNAGSCSSSGEVRPDKTGCLASPTSVEIAENQSVIMVLRGDISGVASGSDNLSTQLEGDTAFVGMASASTVDADANDDLIWSPRTSNTGTSLTDTDWANGFALNGLPASGMSSETLTK